MAMLFLGVYRHSGELWKGVLAITSKINLLQLWLILDAQTAKKSEFRYWPVLGQIPVLAGIGKLTKWQTCMHELCILCIVLRIPTNAVTDGRGPFRHP